MVENDLSNEVVVPRGTGVELEAHDREALACYKALGGVRLESASGVVQDLEVARGVTGVRYLERLVDGFAGTAAWEGDVLLWVHLDHGDENLAAWRERVAYHPQVEADGRVDVFVQGIFILAFFHRAEQGLRLHGSLRLVHLAYPELFLGQDPFILAESSVEHSHVALGNLKEVLVWLIRAEISIELKRTFWGDSLLLRPHLEGIGDPLLCYFVVNLEECPVDLNWEGKLVFDSYWL